MTSEANKASASAYQRSSDTAQKYYDVAIPALQQRQESASGALKIGESGMMKDAFSGQRAGLTEGITGGLATGQAQMMRGSKSALSGGNAYATMHPADIGAKLANALWGSKFTEGQADIENRLGLMSTIMGGSAQAGNVGLSAAGANLQAIQSLPQYNKDYANVVGAASIGASIYGGLNQAGVFNPSQPGNPGVAGSSVPPWAVMATPAVA